MRLQNLTNIHARGHTKRIKDNIDRGAIGQEGHVLLPANFGYDAFVAMAATHFVADGNFAFLCNVNANFFVDARSQLVLLFTGKDVNSDNLTAFAVGNAQTRVANFSSLLAEDSPKQAFFCAKFSFAFRGNFAD